MKPCDRCNKFTCACVPVTALAVAPNEPDTDERLISAIQALEARVAALEAMLRPMEVVAAYWSIKKEEK